MCLSSAAVSDLYAMGFDPVSGPKNFTALRDSSHFKQQSEEAYASAHGGFEPGLEAEMAKLEVTPLSLFRAFVLSCVLHTHKVVVCTKLARL